MLPDFKFHHIGIAVFDIQTTAQYYLNAGYQKTDSVIDLIQNIEICFLTKENMPVIELLSAVDERSPVNRILKNVGVSPYHCCYQVEEMEDAIRRLKKIRFVPVSKPSDACALEKKRVCFLYNKDVGLIELLEQ